MTKYLFSSRALAYLVTLVFLLLLPQLLNPYHLSLVETGLSLSIMALGLNLLLRYAGVLSFGHGAYFAAGAYAVGLLYMYFPEHFSFELAILASLAVSALVSAIFGFVCVRHTRIFFSILTLALAMLLFAVLEKAYYFTGGSDGIRIPLPTFLGMEVTGMRRFQFMTGPYYYVVVGIFAAATLVMLAIVNSPFGKALQATRDNEVRAEMVGIRVKRFRWYAFVISGTFCGLSGGVWSFVSGHITPEISNWVFSGEIVYMVLLGGFMIFEGPIVGAILFTYLRLYAVAWTEYWMLIVGGTLVLLVLLLPGGVTGGIADLMAKLKPNRAEGRS
ncbi:MAG: branched-chain amino acid ABC transporter permease [Desulfarculaceae bacterium]|nr:branched-chain amino acid ABC transporter permease [Desulfarculaceae bacterium]MCF8102109.1 branched-chain amino acid ABC transporter permease [Desulfarculaceae bacterium]MCF8118346.1 branched-chain amino acid ABC transporter permease [Desulfarculaceae bacterium]